MITALFKVGDKAAINTRKYDDPGSKEYGCIGVITRIKDNGSVIMEFPRGTFPGQNYETWGEYSIEDLRPLTKLEKALR
mgnify:CR=1 FL=1